MISKFRCRNLIIFNIINKIVLLLVHTFIYRDKNGGMGVKTTPTCFGDGFKKVLLLVIDMMYDFREKSISYLKYLLCYMFMYIGSKNIRCACYYVKIATLITKFLSHYS